MILVGQYDSPVTRRIGITLHHYGMPFTRDTRSVFSNAAEIARITPLTRIPALVLDDGGVLIDSALILDHLDETIGPARALVAPSGPLRRHTLQLTALAQGCLEKAGNVVYERVFHPPAHQSADWLNRCLGQLANGLGALEQRLQSPYAMGPTLTHADVMATCLVAYLHDRVPDALPPGTHPRLNALANHCETLPAFAAARTTPDEAMPVPAT